MDNDEGMVAEVVIYRVKPDRIEEFHRVREKIREELASFHGFQSLTTMQHVDQPGVFRDLCQWRSREEAMHAFKNFRDLPSAAEFLDMLDGRPLYSGHFYVVGRDYAKGINPGNTCG